MKWNCATQSFSPVQQNCLFVYKLWEQSSFVTALDVGVTVAVFGIKSWHCWTVVPGIDFEKVFIAMVRANFYVHTVGERFINLQKRFVKLKFYCFHVVAPGMFAKAKRVNLTADIVIIHRRK